jgi:hypothetical protein
MKWRNDELALHPACSDITKYRVDARGAKK